ncbi:otoferlin-like [Choristoneura fumiferana]|uniref:otoferlin-like n=1 Tax=Choristoneura fumiferana TaxID=7141 RepID=UPI003D15BC85
MSLLVKLNRFKVLKCKNEKYARLQFRGSTKHSSLLVDNEEIIFVNERFEWAVSRPVAAGEVLTLQLLTRGRWGAPRVLGVYRLGLQILVTDGQLSITDTLVDERNKPVPADGFERSPFLGIGCTRTDFHEIGTTARRVGEPKDALKAESTQGRTAHLQHYRRDSIGPIGLMDIEGEKCFTH